MIRTILPFFLFLFLAIGLQAQLWDTNVDFSKQKSQSIDIIQSVERGQYVQTNYQTLLKELAKAPKEFSKNPKEKIIEIPFPDGTLHSFKVYESSVMQPGISARYPSIRSYKVVGLDNSTMAGRIGTGTFGFHGTIITKKGTVYIDRLNNTDKSKYMSYYTHNYKPAYEDNRRVCGADHNHDGDTDAVDNILNSYGDEFLTRSVSPTTPLNTYRLAISCTGEWGKKQGSVEGALSQLNIAVNKVNSILEKEVAVRLLLVDDNDKVIYLDKNTDPFNNTESGAALLPQNNLHLNAVIGFNNYDVGHIYNGVCDVGGVATPSSACTSVKGRGCTCNSSDNIDYIATQITTHELGHQFSAKHTFNNCKKNESIYGYEPGSGTTIMAYANLCGPQLNIGYEYDYYHGFTIQQFRKFIEQGAGKNCVTKIETQNIAPTVILPYSDGFYIPIRTPFKLDGKGIDENGDKLYYSWEEFDLGPQCIPGAPVGDAPHFMSEYPDEDPSRYFPKLESLVNGTSEKGEVLPFYNMDFKFRLTVRDLNEEAGATGYSEVQFFATDQAGPFVVSNPNFSQTLIAGDTLEVTWDVANTDQSPVNCQNVDIVFSTDGGYTYPFVVEANTPNDGSERIIVPNLIGGKNRVMIRASENIFFDISDQNQQILASEKEGFHFYVQQGTQKYCVPSTPKIDIKTTDFGDTNESISFEVLDGVPNGATYEFTTNPVMAGMETELVFNTENVTESGIYQIMIRAVHDNDTIIKSSILEILGSDFSDLELVSPAKGESDIEQVPQFTWIEDNDASYYIFEISDNPTFSNGEINIKQNTANNFITLDQALYKNEVYFWRVTGVNECNISKTTDVRTFGTEALSCKEHPYNQVPFNITSSGKPSYELKTEIVTAGKVSDVNVKLLKGGHGNFKELSGSLTSPKGTTVKLFTNKCYGFTNFNGGFDSESPIELSCPLANAVQYKPEEDLSSMYGEDIIGTWTLNISDNKSGAGGQINEYILEVCSNAKLAAPYLVQNLPLQAVPGTFELLNSGRLIVQDDNNSADELTYTLVSTPVYGDLKLNNEVLNTGEQFTQEDLDNNNLVYLHDGVSQDQAEDQFIFIVEDGEGGWIDETVFKINIDVANSNNEIDLSSQIGLYPNPTNSDVYLNVGNISFKKASVEIFNTLGQNVFSSSINESGILQIQNLNSGTYLVAITVDNQKTIKKLIVSK